jgi:hypothetical protein
VVVDILSSVIAERTVFARPTAVAANLCEVESIRYEAADVLAYAAITSLFSDHLALIETFVERLLNQGQRSMQNSIVSRSPPDNLSYTDFASRL